MSALPMPPDLIEEIVATPTLSARAIRAFTNAGYWGTDTLADHVARHAAKQPDCLAITGDDESITWAEYLSYGRVVAEFLLTEGYRPGDRVGVCMENSPLLYCTYLGAELAGITVVGVGARAGANEVRYLLAKTGARALIAERNRVWNDVDLPGWNGTRIELELERLKEADPVGDSFADTRLGPNDLYMLNSTSGTTGRPKCVMQFQNRWWYFHQMVQEACPFSPDDVFMSLVPAPFGFHEWTAHFTPGFLGVPLVVTRRFDAAAAIDLIERNRVSVLAAVSTQFILMLNSATMPFDGLARLRVMFTGGERVPTERAMEFERRTGATVLQVYGSNETGALSRTDLDMSDTARLTTAGLPIPEMNVRVLGESEVSRNSAPRGRSACKGPANAIGYYDDLAANRELFTEDKWMLTGDVVEIDNGLLSVVGRASDFVIRGGKNISCGEVEDAVRNVQGVEAVAAVGYPDEVFGERVCCYVILDEGTELDLETLQEALRENDVSKELWPERLRTVDALPMSSGGKIAKSLLREWATEDRA